VLISFFAQHENYEDNVTKFAVVVVITILIFCAVRATAQQHAPTKKQCDADANLWSVTDLNNSDLHISIKELGARDREMAACMFAYTPEVLKTSKYDALASWYIFQLHERTQNFIKRHGLWDKFLDEDAAGLR